MVFGVASHLPGRIAPVTHGIGRPATPGERLVVPGNPHDEPHRSATSPGRVPVGVEAKPADDTPSLSAQIESEKEQSIEYQLVKPFMRETSDDSSHREPPAPVALSEISSHDEVQVSVSAPAEPDRQNEVSVHLNVEVQTLSLSSRTQSGVTVSEFTYERTSVNLSVTSRLPEPPKKSDPIVLDLDGDGLETTGVDAGVRFDLNADGAVDRASVATQGDAFLAWDRNGNGTIDDGRELFGDQHGAANGFAELSLFDDNRDGRIDLQDALYRDLRLLEFSITGAQQLTSLSSAGVAAIGLGYRAEVQTLASGDTISEVSSFERTDGSTGTAADLMLQFAAPAR